MKEFVKRSAAEQLLIWLERHKLTVPELAYALETSPDSIRRVLRGKEVGKTLARKIWYLTEIEIEDLIFPNREHLKDIEKLAEFRLKII